MNCQCFFCFVIYNSGFKKNSGRYANNLNALACVHVHENKNLKIMESPATLIATL